MTDVGDHAWTAGHGKKRAQLNGQLLRLLIAAVPSDMGLVAVAGRGSPCLTAALVPVR